MERGIPDCAFPSSLCCRLAVVGLGYVGLPLATAFANATICERTGNKVDIKVIGYDINKLRVSQLSQGIDKTREVSANELRAALGKGLNVTSISSSLEDADVYIITVPTPIDSANNPNLDPLKEATIVVGNAMRSRSKKDVKTCPIVIYESTVFPGATEEVCVPLLEKFSKLTLNQGFFVGYSPERVVPGDKNRGFVDIIKVTSGSTPTAASWIDSLYGAVVSAGTYMATSIKVAEASKVIENTQRDINIALINELSIIFEYLDIDTSDVLDAAGTKWNFLQFKPGLVGGHCIGVDPYYLIHRAEQSGYSPQVVLSGRRINDGLAERLAQRFIKRMAQNGARISGSSILLLGITFKENCPDLRNSRIFQLVSLLHEYKCIITIIDPWADPDDPALGNLKVNREIPDHITYDGIILAVAHREFCSFSTERWKELARANPVLMDLKNLMPRELGAIRL